MASERQEARRSALVGLSHVAAGLVLVLLAIVCIVPAIEETRWAFTTVVPSRLCSDGHEGSCVTRIAARVVAANSSYFAVSYDDRRFTRNLDTGGPPPQVDSNVVLEQWKGRVVSVLGPGSRRRRAEEWPDRAHDLAEGLFGMAGVLFFGGGVTWMAWRLKNP